MGTLRSHLNLLLCSSNSGIRRNSQIADVVLFASNGKIQNTVFRLVKQEFIEADDRVGDVLIKLSFAQRRLEIFRLCQLIK